MKKRTLGILLIVMMVILVFTFVGCEEPTAKTYEVTFEAGEGTGTAPAGASFEEGSTFTLPDSTGLTKDGSHFKCWNDGTADYAAGASYTMPAKAVTFTAMWEVDVAMHTVTFDPNNEGATWSEQVAEGNPVAKPAENPTISSGKHFRYWADENGEEYSFNTAVTADITLYATYAFKVTFEAGEGAGEVEPMWSKTWTPAGITLPDGTGLTHSEGKVFDGWKDEENNTYKAGDRFVGTANHTFTAVWKEPAPAITISFETTFRGEGDAPAAITDKHAGDEITLPENTFTIKADSIGYEFKGWYVSTDSATIYQPGDKYTIPADFSGESIIFKTKIDKGDFTITYKAGDHATGDDVVENKKGGNVFLLSEVPFTAEANYLFNGWKLEGGTEEDVYYAGDKYELGANTVFVAQWLHAYVGYDNVPSAQIGLYFDTNDSVLCIFGEAEDGSDTVYVPLTFALDGTAISITLEGCEAVSGTLDETGLNIALTYNGKTYTFGQPPVVKHTVTFEPSNDEPAWEVQVEDGGKVAKPATDPTISSGKIFRYWTDENGVEYSFDTAVTADITLYASYAYRLTFDAGEGEGTVEPMWKKMWSPMGVALPDGTGLTHSAGKVFDGWKAEDGTIYKVGEAITVAGNYALTAVWKEPATGITISFETTFRGEGDAPASITDKHAGDEITLPENTFTIKSSAIGYVFKGWYESTDSATIYQPGDKYTIPADFSGESIIFKTKIDKGDFTITYKAGDHATGTDIVEEVKGGSNRLLESTFTPEANYQFVGWKIEGSTDNTVYYAGDNYTLGANTVFVAQWVHAYNGVDNTSSIYISLNFDEQTGAMYDYEGIVYVELTCTLDGTAITITLTGCEAVSGTLDGALNIALTYNGTTYTFGNPAPVVTEYKITYKAGEHGTGADIETTSEINEITLLEFSEITFAPVGGYIVSGWKIEGEEDGRTYDLGASCTVSADTVFVAQWERFYAAYDNEYTATIEIYLDRAYALLYVVEEDKLYTVEYELNGTAISMSVDQLEWFDGTFDDNGLSITIIYKGTHVFEPAVLEEPTEPTIVFDAGVGTGDAPTATVTYNETSGMYKIVLPENTFVAPEGKEFKCWSVDGREIAVGESYFANSGETITVTAVWQDAAPVAPAFEGTAFVGNCIIPVTGSGIFQKGGETYTKLVLSTDKTKVQYTLSDGTVKEAALTDDSSSNWKPKEIYGTDAAYYSVTMANNTAYYLLVSADMSKLTLCNGDDEVLEGGEFTVEVA